MAIEFDCPHCQHHYRLKDELAGKTATCKNCRQKIVVPRPDAGPTPEELAAREAAALAALSDEPAKVEQDAASQVIPVECAHCNHKWTEPLARAGKNMLCPNPECRQRVKIPEAKKEQLLDWRQQQSKLPSLAKQHQEKLEGVQDAADAKIVSGKSLREADADGLEFEPYPLKLKVMYALVALSLIGGLVFGVTYLTRTRTTDKEDKLMKEAQEEFTKAADGLPKEELPLMSAVLYTAGGEHAVRHDNKDKCREALDQFAKAREALRPAPPTSAAIPPARNAAIAELAVAFLVMGGTEQEARDQLRLRWMPDSNVRTRPNERVFTVYEELQKTLSLASTADLEFRTQFARRLTRELAKRGQGAMAAELIPLAMFSQTEQAEAKAVVALEIYRTDKGSTLPGQVAKELAARGAELGKTNPPSVATLFLLKNEKVPFTVTQPGPGVVLDTTRYAYTGYYILDGKPDDALALAKRDGKPEAQVRALTLCADWSPEPGPALDTALGVISANKARKDVSFSPYAVLRLAQIAAANGRHDLAKQFADLLTDEGAKAWAKGDALRLRLAGAPKDRGEEAWSELPDDPKKLRAGHAFGRLWLARQNTRVSGNRSDEVKAVSAWPAPLVPFGKAGVALGLQDQGK
jgi:hypothetical protein